jgi:general secretion pathway protein C
LPAVDAASASPGADAHGAGGPAPSRVEVGALTDEQIARSVTRVHDATFEVAVALLPQVFADPVTALRGARVIPSSRDGRPAGFKLFAIRPGSLPAALGFRNGDLLVTIAGESLVDASRGLELYARLGALAPGDVIRVGIERGGRPSTLTYRIR